MLIRVELHGPSGEFSTRVNGDPKPPDQITFRNRDYVLAGTADGTSHYRERSEPTPAELLVAAI